MVKFDAAGVHTSLAAWEADMTMPGGMLDAIIFEGAKMVRVADN